MHSRDLLFVFTAALVLQNPKLSFSWTLQQGPSLHKVFSIYINNYFFSIFQPIGCQPKTCGPDPVQNPDPVPNTELGIQYPSLSFFFLIEEEMQSYSATVSFSSRKWEVKKILSLNVVIILAHVSIVALYPKKYCVYNPSITVQHL